MARCKQCGRCCAAFSIVTVTAEEAERYGREFCECEDDGRWRLRFVPRSWSPLGGRTCCVFLLPSLRCAVHADKPEVCATWSCAESPKLLAWAEAVHAVQVTLGVEAQMVATRQLHVAYNEYLDEWYRRAAPVFRQGEATYRSPFEKARYDGSDPRYHKDVPGYGFPATDKTEGGEDDGREFTVD